MAASPRFSEESINLLRPIVVSNSNNQRKPSPTRIISAVSLTTVVLAAVISTGGMGIFALNIVSSSCYNACHQYLPNMRCFEMCWKCPYQKSCSAFWRNRTDEDGNVDFFEACFLGDTNTTNYLLANNFIRPDVIFHPGKGETGNCVDAAAWRKGMTCLMLASWQGHFQLVEMLVKDFAANPDLQDEDGATALHFGVFSGNSVTVRLLCEVANASLEIKDVKTQWTPLMLAAYWGRYEMAKYLLERGANVDERDKRGDTSLYYATLNGNLSLVRLFVEFGNATTEAKNMHGRTVLMLAANRGNFDLVDYYLQRGANVNEWDKYDRNALILADAEAAPWVNEAAKKKTIQLLKKHGASRYPGGHPHHLQQQQEDDEGEDMAVQ